MFSSDHLFKLLLKTDEYCKFCHCITVSTDRSAYEHKMPGTKFCDVFLTFFFLLLLLLFFFFEKVIKEIKLNFLRFYWPFSLTEDLGKPTSMSKGNASSGICRNSLIHIPSSLPWLWLMASASTMQSALAIRRVLQKVNIISSKIYTSPPFHRERQAKVTSCLHSFVNSANDAFFKVGYICISLSNSKFVKKHSWVLCFLFPCGLLV